MTKFRHFVKAMLKLTLFLMVVVTVLGFFRWYHEFRIISWISIVFFLLITLIMGYYNARSIKKPFFLNIYLATLTVTFILNASFIFAYFIVREPSKWAIIPMFAIFSIYKFYETVLLVKFSRDLPDDKDLKEIFID